MISATMLKSDQNGIEIWVGGYVELSRFWLKSDQNGIEIKINAE